MGRRADGQMGRRADRPTGRRADTQTGRQMVRLTWIHLLQRNSESRAAVYPPGTPSVLRPHSRLCSAAPAPQAVQRSSVTRLWHRGPAKPISRNARFSARLLHGLGKEALEGLHQILGGPLLHKPPNAGRQPHRLQLAQGRHPG